MAAALVTSALGGVRQASHLARACYHQTAARNQQRQRHCKPVALSLAKYSTTTATRTGTDRQRTLARDPRHRLTTASPALGENRCRPAREDFAPPCPDHDVARRGRHGPASA